MTPVIHDMLELSTAHLQPFTHDWLQANSTTYPSCIIHHEYGWIINTHIWEAQGDALPADLVECCAYATNFGCAFILFDTDGMINSHVTDYSSSYD